ncbi:MAG: hypothetical protein ACLGHV_09485, partial [Gammaproteobacteria bacterium]
RRSLVRPRGPTAQHGWFAAAATADLSRKTAAALNHLEPILLDTMYIMLNNIFFGNQIYKASGGI